MKNLVFAAAVLLFAAFESWGTIINVPSQYSTIQSAINSAVNGDTILVQPGTYTENINFRGRKIVLTSRFYQTQNIVDIYSTIINGSNPAYPDSGSVVIINRGEDSTTVLQGFAITGGTGTKWADEHGAGLYREGGGILVQYSSPVIQNNIIYNNIITNVTGVVSTGGGGVRIGDCYVRFFNNIVMNNTARYGAGIVLNYTGGEYKNNIVCANYGSYNYGGGSGFWLNGVFNRPMLIENNTIADNSTINSNTYAGVYAYGGVAATLRNNVVWRNTSPGMVQIYGSSLTVRYCNVQGGYNGAGNFNADPLFADSNYVLSSGSPCIDKGDSSTIYNDLPDQNNPSIAKYPSRGGLRNDIGAYGGPLTKILTNQLIGINEPGLQIPSGFVLEQNYPNPFNPTTKISFNIPLSGFTELKIYDVLGNEVGIPVSQYMHAGNHSIEFNASGLASGIYFYTLKSGQVILTKKMMLLK